MPMTSVKDIDEGSMITFRSKNPNDTVLWKGTLESVGTYRSVRAYGNPDAYNKAVRQVDTSVSADLTDLTFFLITVDNNSTDPVMRVFADEWIESGSLNIIDLGNKVKIQVDDPNSNPQQILSILANAGYACKILS